jgi:hypothetical protein
VNGIRKLFKFQTTKLFGGFKIHKLKVIIAERMTSEQGDVTISKSLLRQLFGELRDELAQSNKVLFDELKQQLLSAIKSDGNVPGFAHDGSVDVPVSPGANRASCQQATIAASNSQTSHYQNQLQKNNEHWKLAKNSDLESFLSCRMSFVSLCKKKCPDLDTMRLFIFFFFISMSSIYTLFITESYCSIRMVSTNTIMMVLRH